MRNTHQDFNFALQESLALGLLDEPGLFNNFHRDGSSSREVKAALHNAELPSTKTKKGFNFFLISRDGFQAGISNLPRKLSSMIS